MLMEGWKDMNIVVGVPCELQAEHENHMTGDGNGWDEGMSLHTDMDKDMGRDNHKNHIALCLGPCPYLCLCPCHRVWIC